MTAKKMAEYTEEDLARELEEEMKEHTQQRQQSQQAAAAMTNIDG